MRILVVPGSFKGSITSKAATVAIEEGLKRALPNAVIDTLVLADGGEGTLEMLRVHCNTTTENCHVDDPLGRSVSAELCFLSNGDAVIESAEAVGYSLLDSSEMDPFTASSFGLGQLIKLAVSMGARQVFVTMGDSIVMDMGIGMLSALGVSFYTATECLVKPTLADLQRVIRFDDSGLDGLREHVRITCLVDTDDYLCGESGQVQLYGAQKGLRASDIERVEAAYLSFAQVIRRQLSVDLTGVIRTAGSGGVAAALHAFLDAPLHNTLVYLSEKLGLGSRFRGKDLTVTGEGCLDKQTKFGKVPSFVASKTPKQCICIVGRYTEEGAADMRQLCPDFTVHPLNPEIATGHPQYALQEAAESIARLVGRAR